MAKYDWDVLKAKYVSGNYKNLRVFAEKENINYNVLRRRAKDWQEERSQNNHKKVTKIVTKTIEKIAELEADRNARHIALQDKVLDVIDEYLSKGHYKRHVVKVKEYVDGKPDSERLEERTLDVADTKAFANMVSALEKAQKGQRLALGLDTERHKFDVNPVTFKGEDKIED